MNTSWLSLGQLGLAVFSVTQSFLIIAQYKLPRTALKVLVYLVSLSISLALIFDALIWQGVNVLFHFPEAYAILIGIVAFSWVGVILFGILESPTQIHRKILWRLPIIGGLLGYAIPLSYIILVLSSFWVISFSVLFYKRDQFNYSFRLYLGNFALIIFHIIFLNFGYFIASQICYALWIVAVHRILNSFLVKDELYANASKSHAGTLI